MSEATEYGGYSYGYDGASRLTCVDNPLGEDESYAYDAVGNRISASNVNGEIVRNANNELTNYGDQEFVYDNNGNLTEVRRFGGVARHYSYNAENRFRKV